MLGHLMMSWHLNYWKVKVWLSQGLVVINEIRQILRKSWISWNWLRQGLKFRKLQEATWLTVIKEILKFPPRLGPFCQINYLLELFSGYPSYPIQKWYIWASFQTSRKRFRKLQEAIWLTVINEIFKFPPRLGPFCQINYLSEHFSGYSSYPIQKWCIWASFQTSRKRFRKLQKAIWLTEISEIFKFPPHFDPFCQLNCLYELSSGYPKYPTQKWYICNSFKTSRKRFHKLQEEAIWPTVINEIFEFPLRLGPFCQINYLFELFLGYSTRVTQFKSDTFGIGSKLLQRDFVNFSNFYHSGSLFSKWAIFLNVFWDCPRYSFQKWYIWQVSNFFLHTSY